LKLLRAREKLDLPQSLKKNLMRCQMMMKSLTYSCRIQIVSLSANTISVAIAVMVIIADFIILRKEEKITKETHYTALMKSAASV